jgi:hypothetical protein
LLRTAKVNASFKNENLSRLCGHGSSGCIDQKTATALTVALGVLVNAGQHDLRHCDVDLLRWAQVLLNRHIHNSPYPTCKLRVLLVQVDSPVSKARKIKIAMMDGTNRLGVPMLS